MSLSGLAGRDSGYSVAPVLEDCQVLALEGICSERLDENDVGVTSRLTVTDRDCVAAHLFVRRW